MKGFLNALGYRFLRTIAYQMTLLQLVPVLLSLQAHYHCSNTCSLVFRFSIVLVVSMYER